jgi:hypothetical protein
MHRVILRIEYEESSPIIKEVKVSSIFVFVLGRLTDGVGSRQGYCVLLSSVSLASAASSCAMKPIVRE